jgi:hypothetical protein
VFRARKSGNVIADRLTGGFVAHKNEETMRRVHDRRRDIKVTPIA